MSVGWSGNPVIKRGARGKSREKLWTHCLSPTPRFPRRPSGTWAPAGASRSRAVRRRREAEALQQPPAAGPVQLRSALCPQPSQVLAPGRAGPCRPACGGAAGRGGVWARRDGRSPCPPRCWRAAQPHGAAVTRYRARGRSLPRSRARRPPWPGPGPAEGGSSLGGGAAVPHLRLAGHNLEPSRLFLRRCSPPWHCAGVVLGEVAEGLGWGSLPRIRALHPVARAASATKSPSFPRLPSQALAERFTFKCPLGCPRRSCHSGASPPKTERAERQAGK